MHKHLIITLLLLGIFLTKNTAQNIKYSVDISRINDDKLNVKINIPKGLLANLQTVEFKMPALTPGTYEVLDFGRFVTNFRALDDKSKELTIDHIDVNTWMIVEPEKLASIEYTCIDTWDEKGADPFVFEPTGSNFESGINFILNECALFGYFKGFEKTPIELEVDRPIDFYGATSLVKSGGDADTDLFSCPSYTSFVDAPIMYNRPDTAVVKIGITKVVVSVYSPHGIIKAKYIAKEIKPILEAHFKYMNYILPVDKYYFIFYFNDKDYLSQNIGALEHNKSSLFTLPERQPESIIKTIKQYVAHEFFHIITPLYVKSEKIQYFNFEKPDMSRHLWLYEGVTEYVSYHVLVKEGIITQNNFLRELHNKMTESDDYRKDISFVDLSLRCTEKEFSTEFYDVYAKGALIAMCLDMILMDKSEGKYNIKILLRDLARKYGENKPFKDDELFPIIESISYFEARNFLEKCVGDTIPLPLEDLCLKFGIKYQKTASVDTLSALGGLDNGVMKTNDDGLFFIHNDAKLDDFGKKILKLQNGDIILKWNGEAINKNNIREVWKAYLTKAKEGDDLSIVVSRKNAKGVAKEVPINVKLSKISMLENHLFSLMDNCDERQLRLRKIFLSNEQ